MTTENSSHRVFSLSEVTQILQITPVQLQEWGQTFPQFLEPSFVSGELRYSQADLATLIVVQRLIAAGHTYEQIRHQLVANQPSQDEIAPATDYLSTSQIVSSHRASSHTVESHSASSRTVSTHVTPNQPEVEPSRPSQQFANPTQSESPVVQSSSSQMALTPASPQAITTQALNSMLHTVADSQQSMLNVQETTREMLGVIVQDNFNLKHENRKLRERMLELERALAEYQRREETRKEKLDGRLRALEGTLGGIQQQVAQLVQLYRQRDRKGWFW